MLDKFPFHTYYDILEVIPDNSNKGKSIDFSGLKDYPFPFTIKCKDRDFILAVAFRSDRDMWVRAFQVLYEANFRDINSLSS